MKGFRPLISRFLDELVRHEGLGDEKQCPCCHEAYKRTTRRFRCLQCGAFEQCLACVLSRHALMPLHRIDVCWA